MIAQQTRQTMTDLKTYQAYAESLYADIHAVVKDSLPGGSPPRWLDDFSCARKNGISDGTGGRE